MRGNRWPDGVGKEEKNLVINPRNDKADRILLSGYSGIVAGVDDRLDSTKKMFKLKLQILLIHFILRY